jgi:hypothetical protein
LTALFLALQVFVKNHFSAQAVEPKALPIVVKLVKRGFRHDQPLEWFLDSTILDGLGNFTTYRDYPKKQKVLSESKSFGCGKGCQHPIEVGTFEWCLAPSADPFEVGLTLLTLNEVVSKMTLFETYPYPKFSCKNFQGC